MSPTQTSTQTSTGPQRPSMKSHISHGIGGAGNWRKAQAYEEADPPAKVKEDEVPIESDAQKRRRSSTYSTASTKERRASIVKAATNLFRRKSSTIDVEEEPETPV
ncbi:hypothetical protein MMC12_000622 [Toensbergia leucococca]|nr:hypothetical protein [Toensbergia leucococca]